MKKRKNVFRIFILSAIFALGFLYFGHAGTVYAAGAKLNSKSGEGIVGYSEYIVIKNYNKQAAYTFTPNKKGYVNIEKASNSSDYLDAEVSCLKKGTVKITVKETYKKKTKKIGTYTLKIKAASLEVYGYRDEVSVAKGQTFNIFKSGLIDKYNKGKTTVSSSDTSVAVANASGTVNTKKIGSTIITAKGANGTSATVTLNVVNKTVSKSAANMNSKLKKLATMKLTKKNIASAYNSYVDVWKKYYKTTRITSDDYLACPVEYNPDDVSENLRNFFKKYSGYNGFGVSLDILTVDNMTAKKLNVKLNKKVTKYDVIAQLYSSGATKKYKASSKAKIPFIISNKNMKSTYQYVGTVKAGQKTVNAALSYKYGSKMKKGQIYYYMIFRKAQKQALGKTIKAK